MNWKLFITACVSVGATLFPGNGITCGPTEDPHDYFTSFFSNKTGTEKEYRPFYYTALLKFYDDDDYWRTKEDSLHFVNKAVVKEWVDYGRAGSEKDAIRLVYFTKAAELKALAESVQSGKPLPPSLAKNLLVQNLVKEKKGEAIFYLQFANRTETVSTTGEWEDRRRDSSKLNALITEAAEAYTKATEPFLKNKYAFQRCKLAFYNNRYADCIRWYDEHFNDDNSSAVHEMALSYKGGSLFRLGRNKEAAYVFSKAFVRSAHNKRGHYTGFLWATDYAKEGLLPGYLALCKTNAEKATMIALFAMHGTGYRLDAVQTVYELNPSSPLLPLLATREINKLEEQYFTPLLNKEKGGKALYVSWMEARDNAEGKVRPGGQQQAANTAQLFERIMSDKTINRRGLYGAGAAYLHFMNRDYEGAKKVLAKNGEWSSDEKQKAQTQLIQLLIAVNETKTISKEKEAQLLPSMKWLVQKAKEDRDYQLFCRNFFSQILAQQYEQQGDAVKAALAYGVADLSFIKRNEDDYFYSSLPAIDFVREDLTTENLLKLYEVMTSPSTEAEKLFVQTASFKRDDVIDAIGTSHLRDRDYPKAIEWFGKAGKPAPLVETQYNYQTGQEKTVNVDPLHDYLNDWQRLNKAAVTPYTKLTLARKLLELETKIKAGAAGEDKSRLYYQYASALYNMSHYGNSWNAVAYHRSGSDWNEGTYKLPWEKEYYGVYTAREYYQKAYEAATNKEFKAACLFMVAKCAQRQIPRPAYDYNNYEAYEKAEAAFQQKFKNNPFFRQFKTEFGTTKFYQYAFTRCSYLRDYIKGSATPAKAPVKSGRKQ